MGTLHNMHMSTYIYITLFKMTIKHPMNVGVSDMAVLNFGQAFGVSAI